MRRPIDHKKLDQVTTYRHRPDISHREINQIWSMIEKVGAQLREVNERLPEARTDLSMAKRSMKSLGSDCKKGRIQMDLFSQPPSEDGYQLKISDLEEEIKELEYMRGPLSDDLQQLQKYHAFLLRFFYQNSAGIPLAPNSPLRDRITYSGQEYERIRGSQEYRKRKR